MTNDPLPRSDDKAVILSGPLWNHAAAAVERANRVEVEAPLEIDDTYDGKTIRLVPPPPPRHFATVVCNGPCGEEDFKDNRYWGLLSEIKNDAGSDRDVLDVEGVTNQPPKTDDDPCDRRIVCIENLAEVNCHTHFVRPGTPLIYWTEFDQSDPPVLRYFTTYIDETTCGRDPCSQKSQSSDSDSGSSAAGCCACLEITVNGERHQLQQADAHTYAGEGYTLTLDGATWHLGGPDVGARAKADGPCPPLRVTDYVPTTEGALESIECCPTPGSGGSSGGSSGGPAACNAVKDVDVATDGCVLTLTLTFCDGTTAVKTAPIPCCCGSGSGSGDGGSSGDGSGSGGSGSGSSGAGGSPLP